MTKMITGGTGFIGAELAHILVERGDKVVLFDRTIKRHRIDDIENEVKTIQGDLGNWSEVLNAVKNNAVTEIYHIGAMLTAASEINPWGSFRANTMGIYHILEAARLFNVQKVIFSSSFATFDLEIRGEASDTTIQRPTSVYGVGKLYSEGLGRYYRSKFGLDFRCIRYPAVIGPGVKTPGHWFNGMIENAISGKSYECPTGEDAEIPPMLFIKDAGMAAHLISLAAKDAIKIVNYNVVAIKTPTSARDVANALKKHLKGNSITFKPGLANTSVHSKMTLPLRVLDDTAARTEWGWNPQYTTIEDILRAFIAEMKANPERYK